MVEAIELQKVVDRLDLGIWAKLTTARKQYICKFSDKPINPGEKYYTIRAQFGVTTYPDRVRPEYLELYFRSIEIRRMVSRC